jgi:hypothetical protein
LLSGSTKDYRRSLAESFQHVDGQNESNSCGVDRLLCPFK